MKIPPAAPTSPALTDGALLSMLEDMGIAGDIAAVLLGEVRATMPDAGALDLVGAVCDRLCARGPEASPVKRPRKPRAKPPDQSDPSDLRLIEVQSGADAHAAFLQAGWIRAPFDDAA